MHSHPEQVEPQFLAQSHLSSPEDQTFDHIVGALQDIVLEPEFTQLQESFARGHCPQFDSSEENKSEYMCIFNAYQNIVEKYIVKELNKRVKDFSMEQFGELLRTRTNQIDQDLLQMLNSFTDFCTFREMMVQSKLFYDREDTLRGLAIRGTVIRQSAL